MISYPEIDPIILQVGPLAVRWYGMMYVLGFIAAYFIVRHQFRRYPHPGLEENFDNLNLVILAGLILGSRLGYVLFYNLSYYLEHPLEIFATWQGGMSFHGGLIGLVAGGWLFCRRKGLPFLRTADAYAIAAPIGLGLGRLGNFINGELYGRVSELPWAMIFPGGGPLPRHPSQLYESFLEGLLLFIIMGLALGRYWRRGWPAGSLVALFLTTYGIMRFGVEFFREPDAHLGLYLNTFSMGQGLSSLMIVAGLALWLTIRRRS